MSQQGESHSSGQGEDGIPASDTHTPVFSSNSMVTRMEMEGQVSADAVDKEVFINTIEVSMEEVVTLGQIDSEEIEIICEQNVELISDAVKDNLMIVNSMPIHEIEVVESESEPAGQEVEIVEEIACNVRQRKPGFKVIGGGIRNIANNIVMRNVDSRKKPTRTCKKGGGETTHLIVAGKNDVLIPIQSKEALQNMTFKTIDGKTVKLKPMGRGIKIPVSKNDAEGQEKQSGKVVDESTKVIITPEVQQLNLQISPIISTATMAQQTLSTSLELSNKALETAGKEESQRPNTIRMDVPGGGTIEVQKFYLQPGLCRVCLLAKEHLTPIFEDVNVDSNGMIENSRGSNAAHKFSLIAALKTLLDIEVEYNDGLPDTICMECYDELMNFSAYRKRIALAQTKLTVVLDQVKETQLPTFIPSLGEVDIQNTDVYSNAASIVKAKTLLKNSQYAHVASRNLSDRTWDKIFSSLSTIVGYKSGKLKSLEAYVCNKPYVCGFFCHTCNSTVHGTKEDYALHHEEFHEIKDVMYPCDICGNNYPLKEATSVFPVYYEHWLQHFFFHDCDLCSKKLPSAKGVWVHKKSAHGNKEKIFSCTHDDCDKSFLKKAQLDAHMRTHLNPASRQNEIFCTICGKGMSCNSSLTVHMNSVHATEKTWKCDICEKQFKRREILVVHRETVHMNVKKYTCDTCGESFTSQSSKVSHMLRHKDGKNFSCEICSKQFYTSNELKSHKVTHESASHKCDECGKIFKRSNYLVEHKRTHTGEKPNKCPICGREIRMRSNYFKHMRIHKRKNEIPD